MSASTLDRYCDDNGPIMFGAIGVSVRWNARTQFVRIELDHDAHAGWELSGPDATRLMAALVKAHMDGELLSFLRSLFLPAYSTLTDEWYRCGKMMLRRDTYSPFI